MTDHHHLMFLLFLSSLPFWVQAQPAADTSPFEAYTQPIPGTDISFRMVPVEGGTYWMGSPESEAHRDTDEGPQIRVRVEPFWMGAHEVTYQEYYIFRQKELDRAPEGQEDKWDADAVARPSPPYGDPTMGMGKDDAPVVNITQYAALQYCKWLSEKTGIFFRLPTEAEWEYACRAGARTAYSFGDDPATADDYAWHYGNSYEQYQKVGTKKPNPWGLYDMHGNVSEWTLDQYEADFYQSFRDSNLVLNPWRKPDRLHPRTVRGGSWYDDIEDHRCASRIRSSMKWKERDPQVPKSFWWNTDAPFVGFRIIRPYHQPSLTEREAFWQRVLGN